MRPARVLCRQEEPALEPEFSWEREGLVNDVVFACGMAPAPGGWLVCCGADDMRAAAVRLDRVGVPRWLAFVRAAGRRAA